MRLYLLLLFSIILLAGCAAPASRWRDDAFNRFNSAVSAGSQQFAPEETDNILQALTLADRYLSKNLRDEAERLFQLSCQKSQLLYRNIVLSKVRSVPILIAHSDKAKLPEDSSISVDSVSISAIMESVEQVAQGHIEQAHISKSAVAPVIVCNKAPEIESIPVAVSVNVVTAETQVSAPVGASTITVIGSDNGMKAAVTVPAILNNYKIELLPSSASISRIPTPKSVQKITNNMAAVSPKRSEPARTTIYLTFDDGPSRLTLPIASYLNSQGISATFFVLGNNIKGHEKVVRDTVALGHRVGNHTLSHNLHKLNGSLHQDVNEIEKTAAMIEKLGGDGKMVRIPYGASTRTLASTVAIEGGQIYDWDINSLDSSKLGANDHAFIEQTVLHQLQKSGKNHVIMLFHDGAGHGATLAAIRTLVPRLKLEGYRFGSLSRVVRVAQSKTERRTVP